MILRYAYLILLVFAFSCKEDNKKIGKAGKVHLYSFQTNAFLFDTPIKSIKTLHAAAGASDVRLYRYIYYTGNDFSSYLSTLPDSYKKIVYSYKKILSANIIKNDGIRSIVRVLYQGDRHDYKKIFKIQLYLTNVLSQWKIYDLFDEDSAMP